MRKVKVKSLKFYGICWHHNMGEWDRGTDDTDFRVIKSFSPEAALNEYLIQNKWDFTKIKSIKIFYKGNHQTGWELEGLFVSRYFRIFENDTHIQPHVFKFYNGLCTKFLENHKDFIKHPTSHKDSNLK